MASRKDQPSATGKEKIKEASRVTEEARKSGAHPATAEALNEVSKAAAHKSEERELEELRKSLQEEKNKAEQYLTSLKYLKAEFENYQKRTTKEMEELAKRGSERLARKMLSVVDDFERTINTSKAVSDQNKLLAGVEMILKELLKILKSEGIVRIEAVGKKFDPELHEAVMVTRTDKCSPDTVVEELRPGYTFEGRVIRPSMVAVANPPEKHSSPLAENEEKSERERETSGV